MIKDGKGWRKDASMQKQDMIPGGWKSQREVIIIQYDPDPVKNAMEGKKRFLMDGMVSRASVIPNMIFAQLKASWRRHKIPVG